MKVRFTRAAQRDLDQIYSYVSQESPEIASRLIVRLIERARLLAFNPQEGGSTDEPNARVIVAPRLRYFIFYTIVGDEIHTFAIPRAAVRMAGIDRRDAWRHVLRGCGMRGLVVRDAAARLLTMRNCYPAPISGTASSRS